MLTQLFLHHWDLKLSRIYALLGSAINQSQFIKGRTGNMNWRRKRNSKNVFSSRLQDGSRLMMANLCFCPLQPGLSTVASTQLTHTKSEVQPGAPFAGLLHNCPLMASHFTAAVSYSRDWGTKTESHMRWKPGKHTYPSPLKKKKKCS